MKRFTDAGRKAIADKNLYAALSLALMIPDICGSMEQPGLGKSQKRYESWFDKWAKSKFTGASGKIYLSASDCFQLRCSLIHSGISEIEASKRDVIDRIEFFDDSGPMHLGWLEGNTLNGVKQPNVLVLLASKFSEALFQSADEWDAAFAGDPPIQKQKRDLLSIRSSGFSMQGIHFVSGMDEAPPSMRWRNHRAEAERMLDKEVAGRRDDALRRALSTPPNPKLEKVKEKDRTPKKKPAK